MRFTGMLASMGTRCESPAPSIGGIVTHADRIGGVCSRVEGLIALYIAALCILSRTDASKVSLMVLGFHVLAEGLGS